MVKTKQEIYMFETAVVNPNYNQTALLYELDQSMGGLDPGINLNSNLLYIQKFLHDSEHMDTQTEVCWTKQLDARKALLIETA